MPKTKKFKPVKYVEKGDFVNDANIKLQSSNIFASPLSFDKTFLIHILIIVVTALIIYSNTFYGPFVFDDINNIKKNFRITDVRNILSLLMEIGGEPISARPFTAVTFAINYYFGGPNTFGYHIFNTVLHIINGILLYFLIRITASLMHYDDSNRPTLVALFSSLVFISHPIQTESVTYIVTRSTLLSTAFVLTGIILYIKTVTAEKRKALYLVALFITSLLGMASREEFFLFPFLLILYDFFFISHRRIKDVVSHYKIFILVFFTLSYLIYIVLNYNYGEHAGFGVRTITPSEYFLTQLNTHWTYLRLLLVPVNQNLDYDYPIAKSLLEFPTIISFIGYVGLWGVGIYFIKRAPVISFCVLWYMITLAPSSSIIPINDVIFEHRLYLPLIGFSVAAIILITSLTDKFKSRLPGVGKAVIPLLTLIIIALSSAAYARNSVWQNEISLWEDTLKKSPAKARVIRNLASSYLHYDRPQEAVRLIANVLKRNPNDLEALRILGGAYVAMGRFEEAVDVLSRAIEINQESYETYNVYNILAFVYLKLHKYEEARLFFRKALSLNPYDSYTYSNLASLYGETGDFELSIASSKNAIELNPYNEIAYNNLGLAYASKGQYVEAVEMYKKSIRIVNHYPEAHYNLALAYLALHETPKAIDEYEALRKLNQDLATTLQRKINDDHKFK